MEIWRHLSRTDFFNYYFAGVIWWLDLFLILELASPKGAREWLQQEMEWISSAPGLVILGILLIVLPYVFGFITEPLGNSVARIHRPKFEEYVIDYQNKYAEDKRLAKVMVNSILRIAEEKFGKVKKKDLYFEWIRTYVWQKGGAAAELANRAQIMSNLAESLIVPTALLGFLFSFWASIRILEAPVCLGVLLGLFLSASFGYLSWRRHQKLREYYVKHVYRAFLILHK